MMNKVLVLMVVGAAALAASGGSGSGGSGGGGVTAPGAAEVRTLSERIPAGGTVQVKYLLTQPRPISTGGPKLATEDFVVNGVAIASPLGDSVGAAVAENGTLSVQVVSPLSDFGTNLDYPFLMVTMSIPATKAAGTTYPLGFGDTVFESPDGPLTLTDPKPGTLTIGGSVSISNVVPGGGAWPAGTVIRVLGTGFLPGTKITAKMKISSASYVSPTEMRVVLQNATTMDQQPLTANNPDGSQVTYYSYLRGVPVAPPANELLAKTDPIFPLRTTGYAVLGPLGNMTGDQFTGVAVQNPTPGPVVVTFRHDGTGAIATVTLPSLGRVMDDFTSIFGGSVTAASGDTITITATSGVQLVGLMGDRVARTVMPFAASF